MSRDVHHVSDLASIEAGTPGLLSVYAVLRRTKRGSTRDGRAYYDADLSDDTGTRKAKIWGDQLKAMDAMGRLAAGTPVKVLFEARTYQGVVQLNVHRIREIEDTDTDFDRDRVLGPAHDLVADILCKTLVFDIETVPDTDLRKAPSTIAKAVASHSERMDYDEGKVMSLSPYFGKVVSLAVGEGEARPDAQNVTVFVVPNEAHDLEYPDFVRPVSEADLLHAFWALAEHAETVVTYNGRGFDVPFLVVRSLIHGIPARVDLQSDPWSLRPHLDLYKVLTGGSRGLGPTSLDVVCWALGLTSPKEEMDGSMVATAYATGDLPMIATYNAGDVRATTAVYQKVRDDILRFRGDF